MTSNVSQPTIRLARRGDVPALARLRYEFRAGHDSPIESEADFLARCTAWMQSRLAAGRSWRCWIAEDAGRTVGTVWLQLIDKLPNPVGEAESHGYISSLYVDPAARGRGVGSRLLEACLAACRAEAVDAVLLWPTPRSRPLYERYGFAVRDDLLERRMTAVPGHAAAPAPEAG